MTSSQRTTRLPQSHPLLNGLPYFVVGEAVINGLFAAIESGSVPRLPIIEKRETSPEDLKIEASIEIIEVGYVKLVELTVTCPFIVRHLDQFRSRILSTFLETGYDTMIPRSLVVRAENSFTLRFLTKE
ncbi:MAG TPA: hypothetical protein VLA77_00430 [Candidatus Saccharimonadales bacterium]|nr:hypothetical protein [Candidatus Saccharimonadales bacterium]